MIENKLEDMQAELDKLHGINAALFAAVKTLMAVQGFNQKTAFILQVNLEQSRSSLLAAGTDEQLEGFESIATLLTDQATGVSSP